VPGGLPANRPARGLARTLSALFLVALALRPQVIAIGPLLPEIRVDLGMTFATAGLLGAIPVLCMGLFAPLGPLVARVAGARTAVAGCVAAILVFGLLRALAPTAPMALGVTFGIGLGMGIVGPILPMIVRARAGGQPGVATGAYATGIVLGGTVAAAVALPLALIGGWRLALGALSLAVLPSIIAWLLLVPRRERRPAAAHAPNERHGLPWRKRSGWILGALFGLQSTLFYATQAWLANVYLERGLDLPAAGGLLVLFNAVGVATTIVAPVLADRVGSRRQQLSLAALASLVGCVGIAADAPLAAAWVVILGAGSGATFPIALILPVDAAEHPAEVASIAAFMLLVGYALSSIGPVLLGLGRDVTGDFAASAWLLVVVAGALLAAALAAAPSRRARPARV
jgi:CP family cyanate transporter-like MFS transporter